VLCGRALQLSFRAPGDTGVLSSSIGAPTFIGGREVLMNGCTGAGFVVVCFTNVRGGATAEAPGAADGVVPVDIFELNRIGSVS
jgi:hypothetical protein